MDKLKKFMQHMVDEGIDMLGVQKELGTFSMVLFYLREFDKWNTRPQDTQADKTVCPKCDGTGRPSQKEYYKDPHCNCRACNGTGRVEEE